MPAVPAGSPLRTVREAALIRPVFWPYSWISAAKIHIRPKAFAELLRDNAIEAVPLGLPHRSDRHPNAQAVVDAGLVAFVQQAALAPLHFAVEQVPDLQLHFQVAF